MDIHFFYKQRLEFISYFYKNTSVPFIEIKHKIESEEEPYIPQNLCQEEPEYLKEWKDAEEGLHTVGYTCLSMLSSALHSYLKQSIGNIKNTSVDENVFKKGWFNGYKKLLESEFEIHMVNSGVDLELIEQIALARNRIQHPDTLTSNYVSHSKKDANRFSSLAFVSNKDPIEDSIKEAGLHKFFPPSIRLESEGVGKAIYNAEKLVSFIESEFYKLNNV